MNEPTALRAGPDERDQRLDRAFADYLEGPRGRAAQEQILAGYPDLGAELRDLFDMESRLNPTGSTWVLAGTAAEPGGDGNKIHPAQVGDYRLLEELARGGMGVVYRAEQLSLKRIVALKMIRAGRLAASEDLQRFRAEAETVASLQHPHIVAIHEVGEHEGLPYFSMDLVEGANLSQVLREGLPSPRMAAEYLRQAAEASDYAHERGVIHRDLKPSNLLLDTTGNIRVTDFGLAARLGSDSGLTQTGQAVGTLRYMAPEQAEGRRHRVGPQSDVYSLGAILYELLTGRPPFLGSSDLETFQQIFGGEPVTPRRLNPQVPKDLETICQKCLERDPTKRYADAGALADDLGRFLRGEPVRARPVSRLGRAVRWCGRNRALAGLYATLAIAALLLLIGGPALALKESQLRDEAEMATRKAKALAREEFRLRQKAESATKRAETLASMNRESRLALEDSLLDMFVGHGLVADERDRPAEAALWFSNAAVLADNDQQRRLANRQRFAVWSRRSPMPLRAIRTGIRPHDVEIDPSGRFLRVRGDGGRLGLWDLHTGQAVPLPGGQRAPNEVVWSSDGRRVAVAYPDGRVEVYTSPDHKLLYQQQFPAGISDIQFAAAAEVLAVASDDVSLWDLRTDDVTRLPETRLPTAVRFSRNSQLLVVTTGGRAIRVFDLGAGGRVVGGPLPVRPGLVPQFLGDSDHVLVRSDRYRYQVQPPSLDGRRAEFHHSDRFPANCVAGPTGRHALIYTSYTGRIFRVDPEVDPPARPLGVLSHVNVIRDAAFSPDGRSVLTVSTDRTARLWSVPDARPLLPPLEHQDHLACVAFLPGGGCFLTAQNDGLVRVWSLPTDDGFSVDPETRQTTCVLDPTEQYIAADSWFLRRAGTTTAVYEVETGRRAGPVLQLKGILNGAAFSPNVQGLLTLSSTADGSSQHLWSDVKWDRQPGWIQFWDWRSGAELWEPINTPSEPIDAAFHPDGRWAVVVCAGGECFEIDRAGGVRQLGRDPLEREPLEREAADTRSMRWLAFGPQGETFATYLGTRLEIWDAATRKVRHVLPHDGTILTAAYRADGQLLATASKDELVRVWRVDDGRLAANPLAHPDWVFDVAFRPGRDQLVTACRDQAARLWDWRHGRLLGRAMPDADEMFAAAFTPDGGRILTYSRTGRMRLWDPHTGLPLTPAIPLPGRAPHLVVTRDGRHALVGSGRSRGIPLASFAESPWDTLPVTALATLAELQSGKAVVSGSLANLTATEWLERWHTLRRQQSLPALPLQDLPLPEQPAN